MKQEFLTREITPPPPAEKVATCLSATLLTTYHPTCNLRAATCLMSLLAALRTMLQALLISFAFVILLAQLLRQELCLFRKGGGPGLLAGDNLKTQMSVFYKSYPEQRPGAQTLEATPLSPHWC